MEGVVMKKYILLLLVSLASTGLSYGLIGDIIGGALDTADAAVSTVLPRSYYGSYYYDDYGYPYYNDYYRPYWGGGYYRRPWRSRWYVAPYSYEYDNDYDNDYDWE